MQNVTHEVSNPYLPGLSPENVSGRYHFILNI